AAMRPVDPAWAGLAPAAPLGADPGLHHDPATADAGPDQRADVVARFVDAAHTTAAGARAEAAAAGYCETVVTERLLANSAGQRLADRFTRAGVDGILRLGGGESDGVGSRYSYRLSDIDGSAVGTEAADRARRGLHAVELPAGRYEVILEPRCVGYLVDFLLIYGFNARAVLEGRSFVSLGEAQFDPAVSVRDDATDARQVGGLFDAEGTPKRPVALVESGVVTSVCHDRRTAARVSPPAQSTGHAVPGGEAFGAMASNVFLTATGPTSPRDELIRRVERGLLVSDFWYARVLDPKTLVATGLTRNGVFLIENGELGRAVSNQRYTQTYAAALAPGRVLGIGDDSVLVTGDFGTGHYLPSLRLAQWNFTGNASG
ncbi:MAG TPA: metallopeptidase TldD-related protein, partial [Acidimicrobiales bacterium]|nr:metallopeptidase TldD-related protein [Acidimicrobiales bacterium]